MIRSNLRSAVLPTALLLLGSPAANAQTTFFPKGATIDYAVNGDAYVGVADASFSKRTSPTVSLVDGGSISGSLLVWNKSTANIKGGTIAEQLDAHNHSTVNVKGGSIGAADAYNHSTVNIKHGDIGAVDAFNHSTVNISGGHIDSSLYAFNHSTVNISGGEFANSLHAFNSSTIRISAGDIDNSLYADNSGTVDITGGHIAGYLFAYAASTVYVSGGSFGSGLSVMPGGTLDLFGKGLGDTLLNPDDNGYSAYTLFGTLGDGTSVTGTKLYIANAPGVTVAFNNVVPEPGSMAMFAAFAITGAAVLSRQRRGGSGR